MNTLRTSVTDMLRAERQKNEARDLFKQARPADEDYDDIKQQFRAADDAFELQAEALISLIQQLAVNDELSDAMDELNQRHQDDANEPTLPRTFTRFVESRGLVQFIDDNQNGLAQMTRRWQKAGTALTAFNQLNLLRSRFTGVDFEELLESGHGPANVPAPAWDAAVVVFNTRLTEFNEATNFEVEPEKAMLEVAFALEKESRKAYDAVTERLVSILADLQSSGRLGGEMEELDSEHRAIVRDALRRVPQPQLQAQPAPATRTVMVM